MSEESFNVDDDWKNRAEAEKKAAEEAQNEAAEQQPEIPEASFPLLVSTLATQAMNALGLMPGPDGKTMVHKPFARHMIDLLGVLDEKTKGNLEDDEKKMIEEVLNQLRTVYMQIPDSAGTPAPEAPAAGGQEKDGGPSIIMP